MEAGEGEGEGEGRCGGRLERATVSGEVRIVRTGPKAHDRLHTAS